MRRDCYIQQHGHSDLRIVGECKTNLTRSGHSTLRGIGGVGRHHAADIPECCACLTHLPNARFAYPPALPAFLRLPSTRNPDKG
jgi:hypothetical protein